MKMTLISAFEARGCILRGLFCDKGSPQRLFSLFTFFFFFQAAPRYFYALLPIPLLSPLFWGSPCVVHVFGTKRTSASDLLVIWRWPMDWTSFLAFLTL